MHPTYRSLDAPVKLLGLSWRQWLALLIGGGGLVIAVRWIGLPTRPALSICTIVIGVPLALAYLSEETGFRAGRLVLDNVTWALSPRSRAGGSRGDGARGYVVADPHASEAEAGEQ